MPCGRKKFLIFMVKAKIYTIVIKSQGFTAFYSIKPRENLAAYVTILFDNKITTVKCIDKVTCSRHPYMGY